MEPVIDFNESQDEIAAKYIALPENVRLDLIKMLFMDGMYDEFSVLENAVYNHAMEETSECEKFAFSAWCGAIAWFNKLLGLDL